MSDGVKKEEGRVRSEELSQSAVVDVQAEQSPVPPVLEQSPVPGAITPPASSASAGEDVTGLKNALAAVRSELKTTKAQLAEAKNQLEAGLNDASALRDRTHALLSENRELRIDAALARELSDVLPQYRQLLEQSSRSQLSVTEDGAVVAGDRPLSEFIAGLRQQHANLFAADQVATGSGALPSNGQSPPTTIEISAPNGIITGVDPQDIISGRVTVKTE